MARTLRVEIIGDASSLERAFAKSTTSAKAFTGTVTERAEKSVNAAVREQRELRELQAAYRAVARTAERGSAEQVAAARLAADATERLERQTRLAGGRAAASSRQFRILGGDLSRLGRGALVGTGALGALGRAATFASTAFLGGAGITFALRASSEAASNLAEQTSKTQVVFENAAGSVQAFANDALGLARDQALETTSAFGALLRPLGLTGDEAARVSIQMAELGVDLSSFSNTPVTDALDAIRSGLVGESEPLRRYGVLLSEARVQQEALRQSGKRSVKELSNQDKILARVALITRDAAQASGDYERTIGGLANQQRELQKNIRNLEIAIGGALNPAIQDSVEALNVWLQDAENQERVTRAVTQAVKDARAVFGAFANVIDGLHDAAVPVVSAFGGLRRTTEILIAVFVAKRIVDRFAGSLTNVGEEALLAEGRVTTLRGQLAALGRVGGIAILIEVLVNKKSIDAWLKENHLGFLTKSLLDLGREGNQAIIEAVGGGPHSEGEAVLRGLKAQFAAIRGETGLFAKDLDKAFATWQKIGNVVADVQTRTTDIRDKLAGLDPNRAPSQPQPRPRRRLTAEQRNRFFDDALARQLDQVQDIGDLRSQLRRLGEIERTIEAQIAKVKDVTRKLTLRDKLLDVRRQQKAVREQIAAAFVDNLQLGIDRAQATASLRDDIAAVDAAIAGINHQIDQLGRSNDLERQRLALMQQRKDLVQQVQQAFADTLRFRLEAARATSGLNDDLRALEGIEDNLKAQIQAQGRSTELLRDILDNQTEQQSIRQQIRNARQFRALGLTAEGDQPVPGLRALRRSLGNITDAVEGTFLDTGKTKSLLQRIRRVLSGGLGQVSREVRSKIADMLADLDRQLKDTEGPRTKFRKTSVNKLLQGIGLDPDEIRRLRSRLSQVGQGGTVPGRGTGAFGVALPAGGPITVNTTLMVDGWQLARNTTKHQQRRRRRNPPQKRGPFAGA